MKRSKSPRRAAAPTAPGKRQPLKVEAFDTVTFDVPIPRDEPDRLAELHAFQVLDTPAEAAFDNLTQLASVICGTPIALLSLVDEDRQWFKSRVGLNVKSTPREYAFCAHAIMKRNLFVVRDAARDPKFARNPLVVDAPHIRFYAGMPLVTPDNHALGTLCVIDRVPRTLTTKQIHLLNLLSRQAISLLMARREVRELKHAVGSYKRLEKRYRRELNSMRRAREMREQCLKKVEREVVRGAEAMETAAQALGGKGSVAMGALARSARQLTVRTRELLRRCRLSG